MNSSNPSSSPSTTGKMSSNIPDPLEDPPALQSILGEDASNWIHSDETLQKALDVKRQQEITKQEYYKVEYGNRVLELLRMSLTANVPQGLIEVMFKALAQPQQQVKDTSSYPSPPSPPPSVLQPSLKPLSFSHSRSKSMATVDMQNLAQSSPQSIFCGRVQRAASQPSLGHVRRSSFAPAFKFGSPSSIELRHKRMNSHLQPIHQLSPTRIGAHAISSLAANNNGVPEPARVSALRHGDGHLRALSLPSRVTIPETVTIDLDDIDRQYTTKKPLHKKRKISHSKRSRRVYPGLKIDGDLTVLNEEEAGNNSHSSTESIEIHNSKLGSPGDAVKMTTPKKQNEEKLVEAKKSLKTPEVKTPSPAKVQVPAAAAC